MTDDDESRGRYVAAPADDLLPCVLFLLDDLGEVIRRIAGRARHVGALPDGACLSVLTPEYLDEERRWTVDTQPIKYVELHDELIDIDEDSYLLFADEALYLVCYFPFEGGEQ